MTRAEAGDERAWAAIVELHWRQVWSVSRRIVRDRQGAEGVTRESFRIVKENLAQYPSETPLGAWIQSVCRRCALDEMRRRQGRAPAAATDAGHRLIELEEALGRLDDEEREALLLTDAGFTLEELAMELGVAATTIRSRRARARARLLNELDGGRQQ